MPISYPTTSRPTREPAITETFYATVGIRDGEPVKVAVRVARVPSSVKVTTGQLYPVKHSNGKIGTIVLGSRRTVARPDEGYSYYEYRTRV